MFAATKVNITSFKQQHVKPVTFLMNVRKNLSFNHLSIKAQAH